MSLSSISNNSVVSFAKQAASSQTSAYDMIANKGLQDRGTASERASAITEAQNRVDQNHDFTARQATQDALAHNTKIDNTPVTKRGSLLDISA